MAVSVRKATEADLPALQALGDALDAEGRSWRSALPVGPPDLATLQTVYDSLTILMATDGGVLRGWMAYRPDGVIKWLVCTPTPAAHFREATFAMLREIIRRTGQLPKGVVQNPAHRNRLAAMGFTVEPHHKVGWWVTWPEEMA